MENRNHTQAFTIVLFLFLIMQVTFSFSQTFEWVTSQPINYSFNPDMLNYTVATQENGDVLCAGMDNFNLNYSGMFGDLFLKKLSAAGVEIFSQEITGSGLVDHLVAKNEKYFLSGEFKDSLYFSGQPLLQAIGVGKEFFFAIFDDQGNAERIINLNENFPELNQISQFTVDDDQLIYLGISVSNSSKIIVMDLMGNVLQTIEQTNVVLINNIDLDPAGNIVVAGGFADTQSYFGGELVEVSTQDNMYVAKYNPEGEVQWVQFVTDVLYTSHNLIKCDHVGNIYFSGVLTQDVMFGPFQAHGPDWVFDFFLTKLNADGEFQWLVEVPEDNELGDASVGALNFLDVDANNNVYVTGFIRGTIDWGNGVISSGNNYYDLLLLNFSPLGTIQWSESGGGDSFVKGIALSVDVSGNCYMAGVGGGEMVFDTITHIDEGFVYPFLAKMENDIFTSIDPSPSKHQSIEVFPNPTKGNINIEFDEETNQGFILSLFTISGQRISSAHYASGTKSIHLESVLGAGVLFMEIQFDDGEVLRHKVIVN